jgi:hypothetical protein
VDHPGRGSHLDVTAADLRLGERQLRADLPRGQRGDSHDVVWMHGGYVHYMTYQTGLTTPISARDIADPAAVAWAPRRLDLHTRAVMVDTNPRATPIPVSERARAAD